MILIVGLGNPGKKYENTRHNIGFRVIDEFTKENNFPGFKLSKKFGSLIVKSVFNNKKIIVAKPQTFMNNSGKTVRLLTKLYTLSPNNLFIIHDDIDLPLGKIRIVKNRGAAGHKGVESIIKVINSKNFVRFRVGIQPETGKPKNPESFLLQKFIKDEEKIIKEVIKKTVKAIEFSLKEGPEKAMSKFNN